VRYDSSNSAPPDDTVLPREAQFSNQDHFPLLPPPPPPPPPPPRPQYGDDPQSPAPDLNFPFDDFLDIPEAFQPQNPQFQPAPAQPGPYPQPFSCGTCQSTFSQAHDFNRHMKRHDRPYKCPIPNCPSSGFPSSQDCDRHVKTKHPETVSDEQRHYCPVQTCKYATKGFTRADNFQRHMKQHPGVKW